jgi:site-specific recombinase XerD
MNAEAVLQKLSDGCRRMHLSYATEKSYRGWVQSYIALLSELPQGLSSEEKVSAFLTREAKRGVAAATQSQALNAVVFLYGKVLGKPLAEKAGLPVRVTPHVLRHTFATHAHGAGATARDLQAVLGHTKLETTMGYLNAQPARVKSPLDRLAAAVG